MRWWLIQQTLHRFGHGRGRRVVRGVLLLTGSAQSFSMTHAPDVDAHRELGTCLHRYHRAVHQMLPRALMPRCIVEQNFKTRVFVDGGGIVVQSQCKKKRIRIDGVSSAACVCLSVCILSVCVLSCAVCLCVCMCPHTSVFLQTVKTGWDYPLSFQYWACILDT